MNARHMHVEYPSPDLGGVPPCTGCDGQGVTGEKFGTETTAGYVLISDVFCPQCGGCGRTTHGTCKTAAHGLEPVDLDAEPLGFVDMLAKDWPPVVEGADLTAYVQHLGLDPDDQYDDVDDPDEDEDEAAEGACPSCQGREWNALQGFTGHGRDAAMIVLRLPCGCVEDRAVPVELESADDQ